METHSAEVALVGAGPIGIEMAVGLKRAGIHYVHLDARQIGYTISWFAPQTRFFSSNERIAIAGVALQTFDQGKATREEYLAYLRAVVMQFDLDVRTYEPVMKIERDGGEFVLETAPADGQRAYRVQKLILATGGTAHPRKLNIPGEDLPHVSHYFQDPHTYFRKRVLIVGGRNSAVEAAIRCYRAGAHVSLSYRREQLDPKDIKYWLLPEVTGLVRSEQINGHFNSRPVAIAPTHVTLESPEGKRSEVPADFVLLLVGYEADMRLCRMTGVELLGAQQVPAYDKQTMQTNVPGVYVCGTVIGGTQMKYRVFLENCHVHVERIVADLTGQKRPTEVVEFAQPET